ncbi:hypothetical protein CI238_08336 [Colletotrichum incanum]|uniref:Uncharacterized protein n=1 Tax=Colletotrichum incanum TaxID=1573173 RepID=A0A161W9B2_COLIC|nr:hypothetical protein CI238_08336 [Colletotrichum incanum]OHW97909.1 hypothetical protein CSPAE12_03279 [Colletotrichum incanum]
MAPAFAPSPFPPEIADRTVPVIGANGTVHSSLEVDVDAVTVLCIDIDYAVFGVITYSLVNNFRLIALPEWYNTSGRGLKEKVLVTLWFPAIFALWPVVLPPWLTARCGFRLCEKLRMLVKRVKIKGEGLCRDAGLAGEHRDGVELERWLEISLDEEQAAGSTTARTVFVDPFEERGRSHSRTCALEASESRSPKDRSANSSVLESEQLPVVVWYKKLLSPAELQDSTAKMPSSGNGSPSSSGNRRRSPNSNDSNGNSSVQSTSLPLLAEEVIDSDPSGKAKALQRLQTIPESVRV